MRALRSLEQGLSNACRQHIETEWLGQDFTYSEFVQLLRFANVQRTGRKHDGNVRADSAQLLGQLEP